MTGSNISEANTTGTIFKDISKDAVSTIREEKPINKKVQITDVENEISVHKDDHKSDLSTGAQIRRDVSKLLPYEQYSYVSDQDKYKNKQ